jgi:hypothetical protein
MNQNNPSNKMTCSNNYINQLLYKWFVKYNPLYFISALCFVFGVLLVSRGMHKIDWIDGQIILTAVIESYEILLLVGSFILYRKISQTRPAVILAMLNVIFLFDCTFQTEHLSTLKYVGGFSTVIWLLLFAAKLGVLLWIFRLKLPAIGFIVPILAAIGMTGTPYLLGYTNLDKATVHLLITWYGVALASLVFWFQPTVTSKDKLDQQGKRILLRISRAAWLIWGGLYFYHIISWIRIWDVVIPIAHVAPVFILLPFMTKEEGITWAGCILAITFSVSTPAVFGFTSLLVGIVFYLKGWLNHQPRLYLGAILALHLSLSNYVGEGLSFFDPPLFLAVSTAVGLLAIGWIYRLISAFLIVLVGVFVFWNPRGPQGIMEWGSLLIAIGFTTLIVGIFMNWKLRFAVIPQKTAQKPPPLDIPKYSPNKDKYRQSQHRKEMRRQMLQELKDYCPYCKFNLKTGKEKCDECGLDFYPV